MSAIYPDYSLPPPGLSGQLPDEGRIRRYIRDTEWLSDLLGQVLQEGEPTVPALLESAIDYEYELVAPLPWLQCEQIGAAALQPFKSEIEDALYFTLVRGVLDLPVDGVDMTVLLNVTLNEVWEDLRFSYQTAIESPLPNGEYEIHNTSKVRYGHIDYLAWPGTIDTIGKPQNMSRLFSLGWSLLEREKLGESTELLDGSLYVASRNASGSNTVLIKCELHNATIELDVTINDREASIRKSPMDIGSPLSANEALWSGAGDDSYNSPKWAALALSGWMSPLYRNIWGITLYTRETASNHTTRQDPPLVVPETLTDGHYVEIIEEAAHDYAVSLMSGGNERSDGDGWFEGQIESKFMGMHLIYTYDPLNLILAYAVMSAAATVVVIMGIWSFGRNDRVSFDAKPTTLASTMQNTTVANILQSNPVGSAVSRKSIEKQEVVLESKSAGLDQTGKTVLAYKFKTS